MTWHHQPDGASDVTQDKKQHLCHLAVTQRQQMCRDLRGLGMADDMASSARWGLGCDTGQETTRMSCHCHPETADVQGSTRLRNGR